MGPRRVPRKWSQMILDMNKEERLQWGRGVCLGNGPGLGLWEQSVLTCFNGAEACASEMAAACVPYESWIIALQWGRGVCLGNGSHRDRC